MNEHHKSYITNITIDNITDESSEQRLIKIIEQIPGRNQFNIHERKILKIWGDEPLDINTLKQKIQDHGFKIFSISLDESSASSHASNIETSTAELNLHISGMTCHSCEVLIERSWKNLNGVTGVSVSAGNGKATLKTDGRKITLHDLQKSIGNDKYKVRWDNQIDQQELAQDSDRPSLAKLLGLFVLVIIAITLFTKLGLLKTNFAIGAGLGLGTAFIIGLIASASSCLAINGGLLLTSAAAFNERFKSNTRFEKMRPVFLFLTGRVVSYGMFGAALGLIGKTLTPSPTITALITLAAALYMITMGLEMLKIAPSWMKRLLPGMPKSLSHKILDAQESPYAIMPLALGGATFFLPCGFTQALQLYALTTGSALQSGLILMLFALGTVPSLLALGFAGNALNGSAGRFFFQFSGVLIIVLGLWNIQNGMTILGYPLSWPTFTRATVAEVEGSNIQPTGDTQIIKMGFKKDSIEYSPSHFTIKKNIPVRWEVDGTDADGCGKMLISRQLGVQKVLESGINVINFTPKEISEINFSCSMGMYRGSFTVVE